MAESVIPIQSHEDRTLDIPLYPKQASVFSSPATEILYGGAAGGGKSYLARAAAIIWCLQIPGLQVYFFRRQFTDIELNHLNGPKSFQAMLAPYIDTGYCVYNKGKFQFSFFNGSSIKLCHVQKDSDMYNYLGAEIHVLIIDELSQFTPSIYKFLRTRVRMIGLKKPDGVFGKFPKILCCSNPGGFCHSYMKSAWVKAAPPESIWKAPQEDGGMMRQFIPALIYDNPSLMDEDPDYIDRLKGIGDEALVKAYLEGSFDIVSGGMFDDLFDYSVHVLKPFRIPHGWTVDRAFDMGTSRPFNVSWFAESDGGEIRLHDGTTRTFPRGSLFQIGEWYGWNGKPNEGCRKTPSQIAQGILDIEKSSGIKNVLPGPADSSIFDSDAFGNSVGSAMSDMGVEWTKANKAPGLRPSGWVKIRDMMGNSLWNGDGPHLYFFNNCIHIIRTLSEAVRGPTNVEDLHKEAEDHALDTLRYRVQSGSMVMSSSNLRGF